MKFEKFKLTVFYTTTYCTNNLLGLLPYAAFRLHVSSGGYNNIQVYQNHLLHTVPDERAYICMGNHHEMVARYVYGWCIIKYILYTFTLPTQTLFYYNQMPKPSANARICLHTYQGDIPRRQT